MTDRIRVGSGSPFEETIGFCRAIRVGGRVIVSGTAPIWPDGSVNPDAYEQAKRCFDIIATALTEAGATVDQVVRTRMFLINAADGDAVARAHSEVMARARPAATMIVVKELLDHRWKVEIEAEAVIS